MVRMRRDLYKDTADIQRGAHSLFGRVWVESSWIPADDQTEVNCEDYRLLPSVLKTLCFKNMERRGVLLVYLFK